MSTLAETINYDSLEAVIAETPNHARRLNAYRKLPSLLAHELASS